MKTEAVLIAELKSDPANVRSHDKRNLDAIVKSLETFGQQKPIVVASDGTIVAGNGTLAAAMSLGWKTLDVVKTGLGPDESKAYAIADNRTAELAAWDDTGLATALAELKESKVDELATGFTENQIEKLIADLTGELPDDKVPERPKKPFSKLGDLWTLGEHRLLCGDSTNAADVKRLMAGNRAELCLTDPPYGVDLDYKTHDDSQDALADLIEGFFPLAEKYCDLIALTPGIQNLKCYKNPDWILCWFYGAGTGRSPWGFTAWQPFMVWGSCPKLANGEGCHPDGFQWMMDQSDMSENRELDHACPKPLSVWRRFLERLCNQKTKTIYDPFSGSGTTIVACEQLKRRCMAMEIDPSYVDVAVERWKALTGGQPRCKRGGKVVSAGRLGAKTTGGRRKNGKR